MINVHITLTPFRNESRLTKQVSSLRSYQTFNSILIFALHERLETSQKLIDGVVVKRVRLFSRFLPRTLIFHLIKYLALLVRIILAYQLKIICS